MKILVSGNLNDKDWDIFVDSSNNGTIFHKLKFLKYHPPKRFNFFNLVFYEKEKLIAVLPGNLKDGIFRSPVGASYGSFVTADISFSQYEQLIDCFLEFMKKKGVKEIILTPPPFIYMMRQNQSEEFLLLYKGFRIKYSLFSSAINLRQFTNKKDIKEYLKKRFRGDIKKSYKSKIDIKFNSDFSSFYPMLAENKKKFGIKPTHTYEEILRLAELFPNDVKLLMAYDSFRKPIAGVLFFVANARTILLFYICHYYQYHHYKAVTRLLYEIIVWSTKNNYWWLDLGVSMETSSKNPMEPSRQLIFFKEAMNADGFLRTTYYLELKK